MGNPKLGRWASFNDQAYRFASRCSRVSLNRRPFTESRSVRSGSRGKRLIAVIDRLSPSDVLLFTETIVPPIRYGAAGNRSDRRGERLLRHSSHPVRSIRVDRTGSNRGRALRRGDPTADTLHQAIGAVQSMARCLWCGPVLDRRRRLPPVQWNCLAPGGWLFALVGLLRLSAAAFSASLMAVKRAHGYGNAWRVNLGSSIESHEPMVPVSNE